MAWASSHSELVSAVDAVVELSLALLLVLGVRSRLGRIPPLAVLAAMFFLLEALVSAARALVYADVAWSLSWLLALEVAGTVVAVAILVRASRVAQAIAVTVDEARHGAGEDERARRHYEQLMRHRIANPLAIIRGAAETLDAADSIDAATRHELRLAIIEAARRLEAISFDPGQAGDEERELDGTARA